MIDSNSSTLAGPTEARATTVLALQQLGASDGRPEDGAGPGSLFSAWLCEHRTE
ncbi:hypothetical protein AB0M29_31930 [Streptomyces sp. NPDC051976]|uniref:hypothetical protein n=1 Tax=Streptomyces sp. NPDC051976 TaxID=3154947 RepID=UPI00341E73DA